MLKSQGLRVGNTELCCCRTLQHPDTLLPSLRATCILDVHFRVAQGNREKFQIGLLVTSVCPHLGGDGWLPFLVMVLYFSGNHITFWHILQGVSPLIIKEEKSRYKKVKLPELFRSESIASEAS